MLLKQRFETLKIRRRVEKICNNYSKWSINSKATSQRLNKKAGFFLLCFFALPGSAAKNCDSSLRPCPPLPSLIYRRVCAHKGTRPEWSTWRRSCQRRVACWPSRKPRSCPSRRSTGRPTRTRRWLSSETRSSRKRKGKGRMTKSSSGLRWTAALLVSRRLSLWFLNRF